MATIHFILQGKGGVGKSMIASLLYQVLQSNKQHVIAYDTDPVNSTLGGYSEFTVNQIKIMEHGDIVPRKFDELFQGLADAEEKTHVIVDNGASSFVALGAYLKENEVVQTLQDMGHTVYFHSVITGGQAIRDTMSGLGQILEKFSGVLLVVWLNPFFGEISMDGKPFEKMKLYENNAEKIHKIVRLPAASPTLNKDLEELFAKRLSFETGIATSQNIGIQSRLRRHWGQIFELLTTALAEHITPTGDAPAEAPAPETEASNA